MLILRNIIILFSLILLSPLIFFLSILIIIEDGFPAIFVQTRLGKEKVTFKLFKIRTMRNDTAQVGTHDVESTKVLLVGRVIRKFKLDELLQLVNVLKGELNLVGPRPSLENQLELVTEREKLNVFSVLPGITGLGQVCGYDMSDPCRLAYVDSLYVKKKSLLLDAKILFSTFTGYFKKQLKKDFKI